MGLPSATQAILSLGLGNTIPRHSTTITPTSVNSSRNHSMLHHISTKGSACLIVAALRTQFLCKRSQSKEAIHHNTLRVRRWSFLGHFAHWCTLSHSVTGTRSIRAQLSALSIQCAQALDYSTDFAAALPKSGYITNMINICKTSWAEEMRGGQLGDWSHPNRHQQQVHYLTSSSL